MELAEVETGLLLRKAQEAEAEIALIRAEKAQTEAAKLALEQKARDAEVLANRMLADVAKRKAEGNGLMRFIPPTLGSRCTAGCTGARETSRGAS